MYPTVIDSYVPKKNYGDTIVETINLGVNSNQVVYNTTYLIKENIAVTIPGYTQVYTVNQTVGTLIPAVNQFYVYGGTTQILFGPVAIATTITVTYVTKGSIYDANDITAIQDSVMAIENTLGVNPQGAYPTVASYLSALSSGAALLPRVVEDFTASLDGLNTVFTLSYTPISSDYIEVIYNGLTLTDSTHYLLSGTSIQLNYAPLLGDSLVIKYFRT